jgi:hypothetical protein
MSAVGCFAAKDFSTSLRYARNDSRKQPPGDLRVDNSVGGIGGRAAILLGKREHNQSYQQ